MSVDLKNRMEFEEMRVFMEHKRRCLCVLDRPSSAHDFHYGCHPYFGRARDAETRKEQLKWAKKLLKTIESYIV
jgi:hypothetical protein